MRPARRAKGEGPYAYYRPVGVREAEELISAADTLSRPMRRPEVAALIEEHRAWRHALSSSAGSKVTFGGPLNSQSVDQALDRLLPMWSSAVEMANGAGGGGPKGGMWSLSSRVLKQMRNLRMHEGALPLVFDVSVSYRLCNECGERHVADAKLGVEVAIAYLVSHKCPAGLKSELQAMDIERVDVVATIEAAVNDFKHRLLAATLDTALPRQSLDMVVGVWDETAPLRPVLARMDRSSSQPLLEQADLSGSQWVIRLWNVASPSRNGDYFSTPADSLRDVRVPRSGGL